MKCTLKSFTVQRNYIIRKKYYEKQTKKDRIQVKEKFNLLFLLNAIN